MKFVVDRLLSAALFLGLISQGSVAATKGPGPANALENAASPYLRQHSHDTVDWKPWTKEVLEEARRANKPIFLSIGYSTCHWCHVMQRESFQDADIGAFLNEHFVSIKVDRELRPDLDDMYMQATLITSNTGGWPNNVFLIPDGNPFFGMTYAPPRDFKGYLERIIALWNEDEAALRGDAARMGEAIAAYLNRKTEAAAVDDNVMSTMVETIAAEVDAFAGGIGSAPKFPRESVLDLMLFEAARTNNEAALSVVTLTLDAILAGGVRDHIGGGFHRYAVDNEWLVPHFEKMLTTQALLVDNLTDAWRLTGNAAYRKAAEEALDYVLRDMQAPEGGFYAAEDADSEGEEGIFYVWTPGQLKAALPAEDAAIAETVFGVTPGGNFKGRSILHHADTINGLAGGLKMEPKTLVARIHAIKQTLLKARAERERPHRDDKIIVSWNGMTIAALARAGWHFERADYVDAAARAARRILENKSPDGALPRAIFGKEKLLDGGLADYSALGMGLVALYDVTGERAWIEQAAKLAAQISTRFEDPATGDYFMTASADGVGRIKQISDTGVPSASALTLAFLSALESRWFDPESATRVVALSAALSGQAVEMPLDAAAALAAIARARFGVTSPLQSFGRGAVRVTARADRREGVITIALDHKDGWHVNSNDPGNEDVIATEVAVLSDGRKLDATMVFPDPVVRRLGFADEPLKLFEGKMRISAELPKDLAEGDLLSLEITLQPCSDEICLQPETATIVLGRR